jgi:hypothetical protein
VLKPEKRRDGEPVQTLDKTKASVRPEARSIPARKMDPDRLFERRLHECRREVDQRGDPIEAQGKDENKRTVDRATKCE